MVTAHWLDLLGLALIVTWLIWICIASSFAGGNPVRVLSLVAGSALTVIVARLVSSVAPMVVPLIVASAAIGLGVTARHELFSERPLSAPFGYANANAAFFVQASIAGLMVARAGGRRWLNVVGIVAALGFALVPILIGSKAGAALLALLTPSALIVENKAGSRAAVALCAIFVGLVLAGTAMLGATYDPEVDRTTRFARFADQTLTERRVVLWSEALKLAAEHPLAGFGVDGFPRVSPTARRDSDARQAHHEFLQHGAEFGVPGCALMITVFACGFARLSLSGTGGTLTVLAAVALAALAMHSSFDYILHFPAVPLTAAALVGAGIVSTSPTWRPLRVAGQLEFS